MNDVDVLTLSLDEIINIKRKKQTKPSKWRGGSNWGGANHWWKNKSSYGQNSWPSRRPNRGVKRLSSGYRFTAPLQPRLTIPKRGAINRRWPKAPVSKAFKPRPRPTRPIYRPKFLETIGRSYSSLREADPWKNYEKRQNGRTESRGVPTLKSRAGDFGVPFRMNNGVVVQGLRSDNLDTPSKLTSRTRLPSLRSIFERQADRQRVPIRRRPPILSVESSGDEFVHEYPEEYVMPLPRRTNVNVMSRREKISRQPAYSQRMDKLKSIYNRNMMVSIENEVAPSQNGQLVRKRRRPPSPTYYISSDSEDSLVSHRSPPRPLTRRAPSRRGLRSVPVRVPEYPPEPISIQREIRYIEQTIPEKVVTEKVKVSPVNALHRQILDPKIQREIAALQGKLSNARYESPAPYENTAVDTISGGGVKNLKLLPSTTKLGLNLRFTYERAQAVQ